MRDPPPPPLNGRTRKHYVEVIPRSLVGGDLCERLSVGFDVAARERKETNPRQRRNINAG